MKWAVGSTAFSLIIYKTFFSRMPRFVNLFHNPNSWPLTRFFRKTIGTYAIFLVWVAILSTNSEKAMPDEL